MILSHCHIDIDIAIIDYFRHYFIMPLMLMIIDIDIIDTLRRHFD
jgi:hypothetical protein